MVHLASANWWVGVAYLAIVNLLAGYIFINDKWAAEKGAQRVPEKRLLILALIGGAPAMVWLRYKIRHKTRKQPFALFLSLIFLFQVIVLPIASLNFLII